MAELKSNHVTVQMSNTDSIPPDLLLKLENYSKLRTVLRVTAWIKRLIHNSCSKEKRQGELTAKELSEAERHWILETQNQSFQREISEIKVGRHIHKDLKNQRTEVVF